MRLSDAILLGSTQLRPVAGILISLDGSGCALGMAGKAIGLSGLFLMNEVSVRWPWLDNLMSKPCECKASFLPYEECSWLAGNILVHLFDVHVMMPELSSKPWTLEQLVDWVRSVEPAEVETETLQEEAPKTEGELSVQPQR